MPFDDLLLDGPLIAIDRREQSALPSAANETDRERSFGLARPVLARRHRRLDLYLGRQPVRASYGERLRRRMGTECDTELLQVTPRTEGRSGLQPMSPAGQAAGQLLAMGNKNRLDLPRPLLNQRIPQLCIAVPQPGHLDRYAERRPGRGLAAAGDGEERGVLAVDRGRLRG